MPARKIAIDKCTHCLPYAAIAPRTANFVVAADDATDEQKDQADYICDGVEDNVEIQAALDVVPATGGTVILFGHQFNLAGGSNHALTIANPYTVLQSPTFATIAANVNYGKYVVNITANYARLYHLKVHQTGLVDDEQGDCVCLNASIVNPVLDDVQLIAEAGYYSLTSKSGAIDAIVNNCYGDKHIRSAYTDNENWKFLNCKADKMTVKGDKGVAKNNTTVGILTVSGGYCTVEGNRCPRISLTGSNNFAISNVCIGAGEYEGIYVQGNYCYVLGNYVEGAKYGISVKYGDQCTLIGNTCVNNTEYGIMLSYGDNNTRIISNYCAGNANANIILGGTSGSLHTQLIGNIAANGTHYGICIMDSCHYTHLLGNLAYGNVDPGIWLENVEHCVIKGNVVYNNQVAAHGEGGITLYSNADYCVLEGNKCYDNQGTKTQKYGIDILNVNCNANVLLGNDVRNNLTAGIHDAGTGAIIRNNLGYNPVGIASISVTASPFTHTAGASPETVYVSGGTVSSITKGGNNFGLTSGVFELEPYESIVVTYTVAPTMFRDVH